MELKFFFHTKKIFLGRYKGVKLFSEVPIVRHHICQGDKYGNFCICFPQTTDAFSQQIVLILT